MSEVIVRMEMPISCAVCRCHADGWCYLLSIQPSECTYDSRPSWCPIVGVLPKQHGDLIDRGKLLRDIEQYHVSDGRFQHWVELQDAVIAATERSET